MAVDGRVVWTEWEMSGTRTDGAAFLMRGVLIFTVAGDTIASVRLFLEPVEELSGDVDEAARRLVGEVSARGGKDSS